MVINILVSEGALAEGLVTHFLSLWGNAEIRNNIKRDTVFLRTKSPSLRAYPNY